MADFLSQELNCIPQRTSITRVYICTCSSADIREPSRAMTAKPSSYRQAHTRASENSLQRARPCSPQLQRRNATGKASSVIVADRISASWQGLPIVNAARTT